MKRLLLLLQNAVQIKTKVLHKLTSSVEEEEEEEEKEENLSQFFPSSSTSLL